MDARSLCSLANTLYVGLMGIVQTLIQKSMGLVTHFSTSFFPSFSQGRARLATTETDETNMVNPLHVLSDRSMTIYFFAILVNF